MKTTALDRATPTVQAEAATLARSKASKAAQLAKKTGARIVKMKAVGLGNVGAAALGTAEYFGADASVGPVDAGIITGLPVVILGAILPESWSAWGDAIMMLGNGPLCSGVRNQIASLRKTGTSGEYDNVAGEYDNLR